MKWRKRGAKLLHVVEDQSGSEYRAMPSDLGPKGQHLWRDVTTNYEFSDSASLCILEQAARALDRAESCRRQIDEDGEVIRLKGGNLRSHPLLRDEIANRALAVRTFGKLGLDLEPVHPTPGRPAGR